MATVNKDFVTKNGVTAGGLVKGTRLESTVATGTAPLTVASNTAVTNLNADLLDGNHASAFATSGHTHSDFILKFDNGTTEGTDLYTYDGSTGKTINFVGGTGITLTETSGTVTISGNSGTTTNSLVITSDGGTTEGTSKYTFDGSAAKSINFVGGTNLNIVETAGTLTFNATDTNTVTRLQGTGGSLVSGDIVIQGTGLVSTSQSGNTITIATTATNNTGTVTSVGLSLPNIFTVSNSPVTSSGTLTATLASQTANYVLAAPNGTAGSPTFRALVASDIPSLNYLSTSGGTVSGALIVTGDLTVQGTTTFIDSTNLQVEDKNIELGKVTTPSDTTADGGGITLLGATNKTFNWVNSTDSWTSSEHIDLATGKVIKIAGTQVLSATEYTGNAATATKWSTGRTVSLTGDVTYTSGSLDGSANVTGTATISNDSVTYAKMQNISAQYRVLGRISASAGNAEELTPDNMVTLINQATTNVTAANSLNGTNSATTDKTVTVTANSTPTTIDSFAVATYTTAEYLIQMKQGTKMTSTKVIVTWDGTDVHVNEYAITDATAGAANATITATVATGTCTLSASSSDASTTNVVIKAAVTYIKA